MITQQKISRLTALIFLFLPIVAFAQPAKIDPSLHLLSQKGAHGVVAASHGILKSASGSAEPLVSTIVRFQGSLADVEALGGKVRSLMGDIATVDMPISAVANVSQLPNIIHVEASKNLKRRLDTSVPATGANTLHSGNPPNWTGKTGKGVVIGLVDTGIDLNHKDFKNLAGKTRILSLWDQTVNGTHPAGYSTGNECTQAIIDAGSCSQKDIDGHGTHVAGIAAGNGSATGNGQIAYRYVGMAPEADLIVVKLDWINTASVLDAIAYIQSKAAALGKPSVVNLSFGSHNGPHDGTSSYERGLDNLSGVGKVIVAAAGNEAEANIHASGNVYQGGNTTVGFTVPAGNGGNLNIWYPGASQFGVSIRNGTCTTPVVNPGNTQTFQTACGRIAISSSAVNPNNGDREIVIQMSNGTSPLSAGAWNFTLSGNSVTNGRFDAWSSDEVATFTSNIDSSITLNDGATSTKTIAVAAYTTKNTWQSIDGYTYHYSTYPQLDAIASFSSHGPRRSCSDIAKCPSTQKPDIAAPGMGIMSALSAQVEGLDQGWVEPDGVHMLSQGTSMAAPHVAGAVALILQASPTLTSDQIKNVLTSSAKSDSFTDNATHFGSGESGVIDTQGLTFGVPNNIWGYGKLDVAQALDTAPDSFSFTPAIGVAPNSLVTSNTITVLGIGLPVSITIVGGEYSINGGAYTSASGTVTNGQSVTVRVTSSSSFNTTTSATLAIGGMSRTFSATTSSLDTTPDPFAFTSQVNVSLNTVVTSDAITVTGINAPASISISYGEYSVNGGAWSSSSGLVNNGNSVRTRLTSSSSFSTNTTATLTIGGWNGWFSVTTAARDITPDPFNFTAVTGAPINTLVESNAVTVSGINDAVPMTLTGQGEYSLNGGDWTSAPGAVNNRDSMKVRITSSDSFSATVSTMLVINGVQGVFSVTTEAIDTTPNQFTFASQANVPLSTVTTSNTVVIGGINAATHVSITGGEYSINGGAWTSAPATITNGQGIAVRATSLATFGSTWATLTAGGVSAVFYVTTAPQADTPSLNTPWYRIDPSYHSWAVVNNTSNASVQVISTFTTYDGTTYTEPAPTTIAPHQASFIYINGYSGKMNGRTSGAVELNHTGNPSDVIGELIALGPAGYSYSASLKDNTATTTTLYTPWFRIDPGYHSWAVVKNTSNSAVQATPTFTAYDGSTYTEPTPVTIAPHQASFIYINGYSSKLNGRTSGAVELNHTGNPGDVIGELIALGPQGYSYSASLKDKTATTTTLHTPWYRIDPGYHSWAVVKNTSNSTVQVTPTFTAYDGTTYTDPTPVMIAPHQASFIYINSYSSKMNGRTSGAVELNHTGNPGDVIGELIAIGPEGYSYSASLKDKTATTTTLHTPWYRIDPGYHSWAVLKNTSNSTVQVTPTFTAYDGTTYSDPTPVTIAAHQASFIYINSYSSKMNGRTSGAVELNHTGNPGDVIGELIAIGPEGYSYSADLK